MHIRLVREHASIVDQLTRGEIIRAVNRDVERAQYIERVRGGQARFMARGFDVRIQIRKPIPSRFRLAPPRVALAAQNLPLQIRGINRIEINQP